MVHSVGGSVAVIADDKVRVAWLGAVPSRMDYLCSDLKSRGYDARQWAGL